MFFVKPAGNAIRVTKVYTRVYRPRSER